MTEAKEQRIAGTYVRINSNTISQTGEIDNRWASALENQFRANISLISRHSKSDCEPQWQEGPIYVDVASTSDLSRPAYRQMIADAKSGKFKVLVVWNCDRLNRKMAESIRLMRLFKKMGIELVISAQEAMNAGKN